MTGQKLPVTEATASGPFLVERGPALPCGADLSFGAADDPCWVEGVVRDRGGRPIPGACVELWRPDAGKAGGHVRTDTTGRYAFWASTPHALTPPSRTGEAQAAPRLPIRVTALHCRTLVTHILVAGADLPEVIGKGVGQGTLVRVFERQAPGTATPDGRELAGRSWTRVHFDIVLAPAGAS
ncbi:hypothetical protein [Nocardioides sp.]|uniref:hypothetical protein n=1 Tax=Nocardioides sp. TaxID=35761 RepID=UPI003D130CEB